jgi:hypothetical protein
MRRLLLALCLALAPVVLQAWDTTVFTDTFTCGANENLVGGHTPDSGAPGAWNLNEDTTAGASVARCEATVDFATFNAISASARVSYHITPTIALGGADYFAQVTLANSADSSGDDFVWLMLRRTAADTYYGAGWYANVNCYIFKVVGATYSQIATNASCGFVDASVVKFGAVGTALTLYRDGSSVLTTTDAEITATGAAGWGMGNIRAGTDDVTTTLQLNDFSVVDTPAATGGSSMSLLGVGK